jgi:hypothetical protein
MLLFVLGCGILGVLSIKGMQRGWFEDHPPLDLKDQPALLFFNNDDGCECVLYVYQNADAQIRAWTEAERSAIELHRIHLDDRIDLAKQFRVIRAPTLILIDAGGEVILRQDDVVSDDEPFDLDRFEEAIASIRLR